MTTLSYQRALPPLFLIIFIDSFGFGLVIPVMAHLLIEPNHLFFPNLTNSVCNIIFTATIALSPLASLLSHPALGAWSDKWGRKITLSVCLIGSCVGFLLPLLGIPRHSFSLILIGRFISGFAAGSQPIAQAAVTDLCQHRAKTMNLSLIAFSMTLALVLGPLLGGLLSDPNVISWFSNTTPFAFAFLLSLFNLIILYRSFDETHAVAHHEHFGFRDIWKTVTELSQQTEVKAVLSVFFIYEFAWSLYFQSLPLWLVEDYHMSPTTLSLFLAAIGFWMSLGLTVVLQQILKKHAHHTIARYSLLAASVAVLLSALVPMPMTQWLMAIPIAIATGMAYPCLLTEISNTISHLKQGWIMGMASALLAGSWLVSGLLASLVYNLYSHLPLYIAFISYLLAHVILLKRKITKTIQ